MLGFADAIRKMGEMSILIGESDDGELICADLDKNVHLFVSGETGSGKSAFVDSVLLSMIHKNKPEYLKFILFNSKKGELDKYAKESHMLAPVISESDILAAVLSWLENEMKQRLWDLSNGSYKSIDHYNKDACRFSAMVMPRILIVIDDLTVAIQEVPEIKKYIMDFLINGRIVGIHMMLVTQSIAQSDVKKIAKLIPSKNIFYNVLQSDSKSLLGDASACSLTACGTSIFSPILGRNTKVNTIVAGEKLSDILLKIGKRNFSKYDERVLSYVEKRFFFGCGKAIINQANESDNLLVSAMNTVMETEEADVSVLQDRLNVSRLRAEQLIDQMEKRGYISPSDCAQPRRPIISAGKWAEIAAHWPENR